MLLRPAIALAAAAHQHPAQRPREVGVVLIERLMASLVAFIACDLFRLDSRDIARVRDERAGRTPGRPAARDNRQVVVRFGR